MVCARFLSASLAVASLAAACLFLDGAETVHQDWEILYDSEDSALMDASGEVIRCKL